MDPGFAKTGDSPKDVSRIGGVSIGTDKTGRLTETFEESNDFRHKYLKRQSPKSVAHHLAAA
jgi:hypothetical protein